MKCCQTSKYIFEPQTEPNWRFWMFQHIWDTITTSNKSEKFLNLPVFQTSPSKFEILGMYPEIVQHYGVSFVTPCAAQGPRDLNGHRAQRLLTARAEGIVSSWAGPEPRAWLGGPPLSESTLQRLMLAATVIRSAPSYGLALRAAFGRTQSEALGLLRQNLYFV